MKKLFGNLLLLAVIGAVISFFAAPAVGYFAIRSAAGTCLTSSKLKRACSRC